MEFGVIPRDGGGDDEWVFHDGASDTDVTLEGRPGDFVTPDIVQLLLLVDMAENGIPPVAGGSLNQTYQFIRLMPMVQNLRNYHRNKRES